MTDLYLLLFHKHGLIHTIYLSVDTDATCIVVHTVEAIDCIGVDHLLFYWIPIFLYFLSIPALSIAKVRCYVEIFEQRERSVDRNIVFRSVAPVLDIALFEDKVVFSIDAGREASTISHGYFLIPTFVAHRMLAFEWEYSRKRNV